MDDDDLAVDLADQHHAGDVERLGVGDPQAVAELGSLPRRAISSPIWGPPPCTTTGRMPTECSSTMSSAKRSASVGSVMALPPYFTTTVGAGNRRM